MKFFAEPTVRLFLRALLVAGVVFSSKFFLLNPSGQHVTYTTAGLGAAIAGAVLAFGEVFTPLNALVGHAKPGSPLAQLEQQAISTLVDTKTVARPRTK